MPSKISIQTYTTLDRRMKKFRQRIGVLNPTTFPFKASNYAGFLAFETLWNTEYPQLKLADSTKQAATGLVVASTTELLMFCSHYLQVMFLAMKRSEIPYAALALYDLPVSEDSKLPDMNTEAKLLQVAANIIEGDAARLAGGGVAMSNPPVAQVAAKLSAYNNLQNSQSVAKESFRKEQTDVANIFLQGVGVMRKLYVDIEYFHDGETQPFINDILREWGVEFYNNPGEETEVVVTLAIGAKEEVAKAVLGGTSKGFISLLTNAAPVKVGIQGRPGSQTLTFNQTQEVTYESIGGEAGGSGPIELSNESGVEVQVKVKVVG